MPTLPPVSQELAYLLLIFALMVVPRIVQRWRVPAPLTSFGLGMAATLAFGALGDEPTLALMATLGISSLFLFAGLEIDLEDFRRSRALLLQHLSVRAVALGGVAWAATAVLALPWQAAVLLGLAVLTPSAGFILDTLPGLDLTADERYWVRMKAISGELFALVVLFVVLQSDSMVGLAGSSAALVAMIVGLPVVFIALGRVVIPHARGSEFSLLLMVGVIAAYLTHLIGVYYLVGAFLAGFVAKLLRKRMPSLASDDNLHAIRMFASFFVPFYFFYKGMGVPSGALTLQALSVGAALTLVVLPLRILIVWMQRRIVGGETKGGSLRVAVALTPTLIFTLVLATILRERFGIDDALYGGLLIYAGLATLLPTMGMSRPVDVDLLPDDLARPTVVAESSAQQR